MRKLPSLQLPIAAARGAALIILLVVVLVGCTTAGPRLSETSVPAQQLPTAIALTIQALEESQDAVETPTSPAPFATPTYTDSPEPPPLPQEAASPPSEPSPTPETPVVTRRPPTSTPTATATPQAQAAYLQISRPGPASRVVSPLRVGASVFPGARGNVRVELLGEDGRVLVRKIQTYQAQPNARVNVNLELEFEITAVAEAGRLVVSTEDAQGRLIALASVDLVLLSFGEEDINPPGDLLERLVIREPARNLLIQGGSVVVSGMARPVGGDPLLVQMFNNSGQQIGPSRLVSVTPNPDGSHAPFSVEVPYTVTSPTWVRIHLSERDFRIPSTLHLSSVEVLLSP